MSNRYLAALTMLAATAALSPAIAADPPRDCTRIEDYKEMVACYAANSQNADAEVTRVYAAVLQKMNASANRDLLISSQAAWLAYRTAYCSFVSSAVEGGSIQPTIRGACLADMARLRTKELEHQLNCREGDMSCVVPNRQP